MIRGHQNKQGFTIVELLIVVVVIAILAAITIVSYNGISQRAQVSALQTDFKNAITKLEAYRATTGAFPASNDAALEPVGIKVSPSLYATDVTNFLYCLNGSTGRVAIVARSTRGIDYVQTNTTAFAEYTGPVLTDFSGVCNSLVNTNSPRYGYVSGWRAWTGAQ